MNRTKPAKKKARAPAKKTAPRVPVAAAPAKRSPGGASRSAGSRPVSSPIDGYLEGVAGERRVALEKLRKTIRSIVPRAEECISYRIPAFRLEGRIVAGFCATAKGCSYFPFSGSTLATLAADLAGYEGTKSALHFRPDEPLPAALVRKLIKARIAERR